MLAAAGRGHKQPARLMPSSCGSPTFRSAFRQFLIALLIDGVLRGILPRDRHDDLAVYVLVFAIAVSVWVHFSRTVRGSTMVEKNKEYVQAARVIGVHPFFIMVRHVLPNVSSPVLAI